MSEHRMESEQEVAARTCTAPEAERGRRAARRRLAAAYAAERELGERFVGLGLGGVCRAEIDRVIDERPGAEALLAEWSR